MTSVQIWLQKGLEFTYWLWSWSG